MFLSYVMGIYNMQGLSILVFFSMAQQPPVGQGLLIIKAPRSYSDTILSVELLWSSDQPDTETSTWQTHHTTSMISAGFEPAIPASERSQTHDIDRAGSGTVKCMIVPDIYIHSLVFSLGGRVGRNQSPVM